MFVFISKAVFLKINFQLIIFFNHKTYKTFISIIFQYNSELDTYLYNIIFMNYDTLL